jgi:hypothetical protein
MPKVRITGPQQHYLRSDQEDLIAYRKRLERGRKTRPRATPYLDDRLYDVHQGPVVRGSYRGRRKKIFHPETQPGDCVARTLVSDNGWHRIVVSVNGRERWRSPASRDREAVKSWLQPTGRK